MSILSPPPPRTAGARARIALRGVPIDVLTERQTVEAVLDALDDGRGGAIVTVNLQHLHRCEHDPDYRSLVGDAELVVADGVPLVWAARLQGTPLPERVAGSSLVSTLAAAAAPRGRTIFLLGGDDGAAEGAAAALVARSPDLEIAGIHVPPLGFERDDREMAAIRDAIVSADPDIVYVALGSPKQEHLIRAIRDVAPGAWWIGVGISLGFLAGDVKRAPVWVQRVGLEWLHRFIQEPRRLARRYLVEGIPFGLRLLAGAIRCSRAAPRPGSGCARVP